MSKINVKKDQIWLEKFDCFSITGKDSKRFLNGITTGNIVNLNNNVLQTCWLSPNGILKSLLEINCLENKLDVIVFVGNTSEIRKYFNEIIFPSDDVLLSDTFSINRLQHVDDINSWRVTQPIFFHNKDKEYAFYNNNPNLMNTNDLQSWKINQAIPSLDSEINGKNNPLELGLADLVDFNKGCYLGQETMSKIRNVSSLKQEIRVWTAKDRVINIESDSKKIYNNQNKEKTVGYITSIYKSDSLTTKGLALIKRKYLDKENSFFSDKFGQISIDKSVGSTFL
ncbi:aminomethyltransferase GcvT-like protein [Prochlorococcus marinus str. MIT 9515]|uniref:Aminomethyltransferase GcvT-like protein n=1 Tax=Prochlorococcus marinus (strain MIT 9515) TaxID=167542 RepID=A2BUQ7_PROM5|nr:folate-binding protein YgfZ [Prochlorococcus marinus]ABM71518.1 aminomethyltransferase GcvT-like protein [Prochlorococcus marinus str. MIT 9515]